MNRSSRRFGAVLCSVLALMLFALPSLAYDPDPSTPRSDIPAEYQWRYDHVFTSLEAWESELAAVEAIVPELSGFEGHLGESADVLHQAMTMTEDVVQRLYKLYIYTQLRLDPELSNSDNQAMQGKVGFLFQKFGSTVSYMEPELLDVPKERIDGFLSSRDDLSIYQYYFDDMFRMKAHSLTKAEERILSMAAVAMQEGKVVQASVQSAFGCGYEGVVPPDKVLRIIDAYLNAGIKTVSLADTAGHADPNHVSMMFDAVFDLDATTECACHFHNTYGMAIANCYAAWKAGVTIFEGSIAGLGGCPFTAVAGGNVCSEDLVHMFQRMGLRKDIKLASMLETARQCAEYFDRDLPGMVYRIGAIADQTSARENTGSVKS